MILEDVLSTLILIGVVYGLFRWLRKPSGGIPAGTAAIRGVNRQMVDTVQSAFPDLPAANIIYSLSRTRSTQATSEEILERGYLPAPPASFSIPASLLPEQPTPVQSTSPTTDTKSTALQTPQTLIDRFNLSGRLPSRKGKERDPAETPVSPAGQSPTAQQKNEWASTKEQREQELRQRKEKMILEARRRLLEKQAQAQEAAPASM